MILVLIIWSVLNHKLPKTLHNMEFNLEKHILSGKLGSKSKCSLYLLLNTNILSGSQG